MAASLNEVLPITPENAILIALAKKYLDERNPALYNFIKPLAERDSTNKIDLAKGEAQCLLAQAYQWGLGCTVSSHEAIKLLFSAHENNCERALGLMVTFPLDTPSSTDLPVPHTSPTSPFSVAAASARSPVSAAAASPSTAAAPAGSPVSAGSSHASTASSVGSPWSIDTPIGSPVSASRDADVAKFSLGSAHLRVMNAKEAIEIFTELASRNGRDAQRKLGEIYDLGLGGAAQDKKLALVWYRKAYNQGQGSQATPELLSIILALRDEVNAMDAALTEPPTPIPASPPVASLAASVPVAGSSPASGDSAAAGVTLSDELVLRLTTLVATRSTSGSSDSTPAASVVPSPIGTQSPPLLMTSGAGSKRGSMTLPTSTTNSPLAIRGGLRLDPEVRNPLSHGMTAPAKR